MSHYLELIINKIKAKNPEQAAKISNNLGGFDQEFVLKAESFYKKYADYLAKDDKTLDFGVE